jgi:hypothetical protein
LESNRGFAFGLFYVIMNVAALLSGPAVDICTKLYKGGADEEATKASTYTNDYMPQEWTLTGYRLVLLTCVVANLIAVLVSLTIREIKLVEPKPSAVTTSMDESQSSQEEAAKDELNKDYIPVSNDQDHNISTFTPLQGSAWSILQETVQNKVFWRYLAVILITLNVRMVSTE